MQYITYQEYLEIGGTVDITAFNRSIYRVCGIIDGATFRRIEKMSVIPEAVKALCRELMDYLTVNTTAERTVTGKSQSSGPVSESESYAVKSNEEQAEEINNIICDYLLSVTDDKGTPLLYRGCSD